ncbi:hypothetical protein [Flocculibacter collagenilyticus]|uniref:hypothetical protein n=1 Tax=Flocculibacter collagenilyticus TaxID=2744479 RepID=UPI0018F5950C|nr:hypothetical protein [Flocculibacter collagenilyticus]
MSLKSVVHILLSVLLAVVLGIALLLVLIVERQPIVTQVPVADAQSVAQVKLMANLTRAKLRSQHPQLSFRFSQRQLDALSAVASHTVKQAKSKINISGNTLLAAGSLALSPWFDGYYVNVLAEFEQRGSDVKLTQFVIGDLPLPISMTEWLAKYIAQKTLDKPLYLLTARAYKNAVINKHYIASSMVKPKGLINQKNGELVSSALFYDTMRTLSGLDGLSVDVEDVSFYIQKIKGFVDEHQLRGNVSLAPFINYTFDLAATRAKTGNAKHENEAALWALAASFGNPRFARLIGDINLAPINYIRTRVTTTLAGRQDLALHFLYSAVIERLSEQGLSLAIGELKELLDSNTGGSGFSFADLAADMAGIAFAQSVTQNEEKAQQVQAILRFELAESHFFPSIKQLPEGLDNAHFKDQFGDTKSEQYQQLVAIINQRISALSLYQALH